MITVIKMITLLLKCAKKKYLYTHINNFTTFYNEKPP